MSMFKFKDLYVTLAAEESHRGKRNPGYKPSGEAPPTAPPPANLIVLQPPAPPTTVASTACCATHSFPILIKMHGGRPPDAQKTLLEYLTSELARPDVTMENIQGPSDMQTIADVKALEQKLNVAMGELQVRKAQLQKKGTAQAKVVKVKAVKLKTVKLTTARAKTKK